jgi:hypothetical protein
MIKKGDKVLVKAVVWTKNTHVPYGCDPFKAEILHQPSKKSLPNVHSGYIRPLKRALVKESLEGLVIGRSTRISCVYHWARNIGEGYITDSTTHKVVMVTPLNNQRYFEPYACLEEDLIKFHYRVRVYDGWGKKFLGDGYHIGHAKVYAVRLPDGTLASPTNVEEPFPDEMLEVFAETEVEHFDNPKLLLDDGTIKYGCQTWWTQI